MRAFTILLGALLLCGNANANSTKKLWDGRMTVEYGNPSVTLHPETGITISIPEAAMAIARNWGLSDEQIAAALLREFGQLCSDVSDLRKGALVVVKLHLQRQPDVEVRGDSARTEETFSTLTFNHIPERNPHCSGGVVPTS